MRFVGVDLAWSPSRPSGLAVLDEEGRVVAAASRIPLEDVVPFCLAHGDEPAVVAVDAPLKVPNLHGHRPADRELMAAFARFRLGVHVASRSRLLRVHGCIRGEELAGRLAGFVTADLPDEQVLASGSGRWLVEVYPHAALVAWFGLSRPLAYKRVPLKGRRQALQRLAQMLGWLERDDPPLRLAGAPWLPDDWGALGQREADQVEGLLDAVICAHVARYCHRWAGLRCRLFGAAQSGRVLTPVPRTSGSGLPHGEASEADGPAHSPTPAARAWRSSCSRARA